MHSNKYGGDASDGSVKVPVDLILGLCQRAEA